jgi:hypothetical protein
LVTVKRHFERSLGAANDETQRVTGDKGIEVEIAD